MYIYIYIHLGRGSIFPSKPHDIPDVCAVTRAAPFPRFFFLSPRSCKLHGAHRRRLTWIFVAVVSSFRRVSTLVNTRASQKTERQGKRERKRQPTAVKSYISLRRRAVGASRRHNIFRFIIEGAYRDINDTRRPPRVLVVLGEPRNATQSEKQLRWPVGRSTGLRATRQISDFTVSFREWEPITRPRGIKESI